MTAGINRKLKENASTFAAIVIVGIAGMMATRQATAQTPVVTEASKLLASDGAPDDLFGYSVSISETVAIVGAWKDNDAGDNSGSAYIFRFDGTTWSEEAKLTTSDAAWDDRFGISVSIDGDVAVVGAYLDGPPSAYVFRFDGTTWNEEAKLTKSDGPSGDNFGFSVSNCDDVIIIGAQFGTAAVYNSGSAYVFRFDGTNWNEEAKLLALDAAPNDRFGNAVSISGNVALVGAYGDDDAGSESGSAYVYEFDGANWNQIGKLTASDGAADARFGDSVSVRGDVALVGAWGDGHAGIRSGAAYVFRDDGTNWNQEAKLTASDASIADDFGISVAIDQDVAVVGAWLDDPPSTYIYQFDGTSWNEEVKLTSSDGFENWFGTSVSVSSDFVIIGNPFDDDNGTDAGSVHTYRLSDLDSDGLNNADELTAGTDVFNPDTDGDGLLDGTEVDMAQGGGCPNPLDPDSDNDTLSDGAEVAAGTSPCTGDTDNDGLPDAVDPQPTTPDTSSGALEDTTRGLADFIDGLALSLFDASNDNAAAGRQNSLTTRLHNAANRIADGDNDSALDLLTNVLNRVDGEQQPPDWMLPSDEATVIRDTVLFLISQLS